MANLTVETMGRVVSNGDVETLMGGAGPVSDMRVRAEMANQGMQAPPSAPGDNAKTFASMLEKSVANVNTMQIQANQAIHELVAGRNKNIHETMLAIERADTSLKLMMNVRNKVLDAYREIMRMQV